MTSLSFDFSNVSDADLDGGSWIDQAGDYLVQITAVDDTFTRDAKAIVVDFQVIQGKPEGQEGRRHRERLYCSPKAMARILKFSVAAGLGTREQLIANKAAIDLTQAVGRQIGIRVVGEQYTTDAGEQKTAYKVGYLEFHPIRQPTAQVTPASSHPPQPTGSTQQAAPKSAYADL